MYILEGFLSSVVMGKHWDVIVHLWNIIFTIMILLFLLDFMHSAKEHIFFVLSLVLFFFCGPAKFCTFIFISFSCSHLFLTFLLNIIYTVTSTDLIHCFSLTCQRLFFSSFFSMVMTYLAIVTSAALKVLHTEFLISSKTLFMILCLFLNWVILEHSIRVSFWFMNFYSQYMLE